MKAPIKRYPLHQCALYNCSSKKKLEHRLKLNAGGASLLENMIQYHKFSIPKKVSTQLRDITAPADALKKVVGLLMKNLFIIGRRHRFIFHRLATLRLINSDKLLHYPQNLFGAKYLKNQLLDIFAPDTSNDIVGIGSLNAPSNTFFQGELDRICFHVIATQHRRYQDTTHCPFFLPPTRSKRPSYFK